MNLPNLITLARLIAVPLVVWAILAERPEIAFWLFLAAGISDALDGYIAKRFGLHTELGAFLDPLADKALLVAVYVTLALAGSVPVWLAMAVVARDVLIVSAAALSWWQAVPVAIRPLAVSKLNTAAQIGFAALVLAASGVGFVPGPVMGVGALVVVCFTGLSGIAYLFEWFRQLEQRRLPR